MKIFWIVFLPLMLAVYGCSDGPEDEIVPDPDTLEVGRPEVIFGYDELTPAVVTVDTNVREGYRLEISGGDWFDVEESDKQFTITPKTTNESTDEPRRASITVTAGSAAGRTVAVRQQTRAMSGNFDVTPREIIYDYRESLSAKRVDVTADVDGGYRVNNTAPNWIEVDVRDDYFTVTPRGEWNYYSDRTANIHVLAGDESITVVVTQKGSGVVEFGFENISQFDPAAIPWSGTADGPLKFAETDATTYDKDYTLMVDREAGFDENSFRVELQWGVPSLGEEVDKRYLRVYISKNRTSVSRYANVTVTADEDPSKSQTIRFSQQEMSLDPVEVIAAETWHIYFDERYEDLVPPYRRNGSRVDGDYKLTYDRDDKLLYVHKSFGLLADVKEMILSVEGDRIYTAHNVAAGFFNYTTTLSQWVVAIKPGEIPVEDELVWEIPTPARTEWEYDLNAAEPYLRPLPIFINGVEHKVAVLTRNAWDYSAWPDYDPDDPLEIRDPNNYCWGLFTDMNYTLVETD